MYAIALTLALRVARGSESIMRENEMNTQKLKIIVKVEKWQHSHKSGKKSKSKNFSRLLFFNFSRLLQRVEASIHSIHPKFNFTITFCCSFTTPVFRTVQQTSSNCAGFALVTFCILHVWVRLSRDISSENLHNFLNQPYFEAPLSLPTVMNTE